MVEKRNQKAKTLHFISKPEITPNIILQVVRFLEGIKIVFGKGNFAVARYLCEPFCKKQLYLF